MKTNNKRIEIRLSESLLTNLHEHAQALKLSDSAFIRKAIVNYIKYFDKMPLDEFKNYINDANLSKRIAELIEIAKCPWVNIDNDD